MNEIVYKCFSNKNLFKIHKFASPKASNMRRVHASLNYPYLKIKEKLYPKTSGCDTVQGLIGKVWINNFLADLALKVINIKHVKLWLFHVLYYYPLDEDAYLKLRMEFFTKLALEIECFLYHVISR